jgi:hypothetical protein
MALMDAAAPKPPSALTLYNLVKEDWTIGVGEFEWHTELNLGPVRQRANSRFYANSGSGKIRQSFAE